MRNIFYSVGRSVANLMTGDPTVSISGGVATFSVPQTGHIGIGDRIFYHSSLYYCQISGKISTAQWAVVTTDGSPVSDCQDEPVHGIQRTFSNLNTAYSSAPLSQWGNFNQPHSSQVTVTLALYYDGLPDHSQTINSVANYYNATNTCFVRVTVPNDTETQCNFSSRHQGKYSEEKFHIKPSAGNFTWTVYPGIRIDGIQFHMLQAPVIGYFLGLYCYQGTYAQPQGLETIISNCIFKGSQTHKGFAKWNYDDPESGPYVDYVNVCAVSLSYSPGGGYNNPSIYAINKVFNNIFYDFLIEEPLDGIYYAIARPVYLTPGGAFYVRGYFYNNTICNVRNPVMAMHGNGETNGNRLKNNLVQDMQVCSGPTPVLPCWDAVFMAYTEACNNCSDDGTQPGTSGRNGEVVFLDEDEDDFRLSADDPIAKDYGVDLTGDPYCPFSTDNQGCIRTGTWDIGANEYIIQLTKTIAETGSGSDALGILVHALVAELARGADEIPPATAFIPVADSGLGSDTPRIPDVFLQIFDLARAIESLSIEKMTPAPPAAPVGQTIVQVWRTEYNVEIAEGPAKIVQVIEEEPSVEPGTDTVVRLEITPPSVNVIEVSETKETVQVSQAEIQVVETGVPGPPGPQGPPGTGGDQIITEYLAGLPLGGQRVAVIGIDGKLYYADCTNTLHANRVLGITIGAVEQEAPAALRAAGIMTEPTWNWDLSKFIYLGQNGLLTQTPPDSGFLLELGWPISSTSMMIQIEFPILLA